MKLSEQTIDILRNFATIQTNIVFRPGKTVKTMAEAKNVLASAEIQEEIPREFGVYDLNSLLGAVDLVEDPEIEFGDESLTITGGQASIKYFYAALANLTAPTKDIKMPKCEVNLTLTAKVLAQAKKASSFLGHATLVIAGNGGQISLSVADLKNPTANVFTIGLGEVEEKQPFNFVFAVGNLKMLPDDYEVSLSSKLISSFKARSRPVTYFVAMEKDSKFGA